MDNELGAGVGLPPDGPHVAVVQIGNAKLAVFNILGLDSNAAPPEHPESVVTPAKTIKRDLDKPFRALACSLDLSLPADDFKSKIPSYKNVQEY